MCTAVLHQLVFKISAHKYCNIVTIGDRDGDGDGDGYDDGMEMGMDMMMGMEIQMGIEMVMVIGMVVLVLPKEYNGTQYTCTQT